MKRKNNPKELSPEVSANGLDENQILPSSGVPRRDFLRLAGLGLAATAFAAACKSNVLNPGTTGDAALATGSKLITNTGGFGGKLVLGSSASTCPNVESGVQSSGAPGFHFHSVRIYTADGDTDIPSTSFTFGAREQGSGGNVYIPIISLNVDKYPHVWDGSHDATYKAMFDSIAYHWGSQASHVSGPWGSGAYPVVLSFQHEFTDDGAAGKSYDPSNPLTQPQQYAKAMRYLVNLQRSYKPGLNVNWTWIPMAYSFWSYTGSGLNAAQQYWPGRVGGTDTGAPDFSNVSFVDIVGCDGYISAPSDTFESIFNKGGVTATSTSVIAFARSCGPSSLPWLIAEWGVDEKWDNTLTPPAAVVNWKKDALTGFMTGMSTYQWCVIACIWPNATVKNDNRWNSSPKTGPDNGTMSNYGTPNNSGVSAQKFVSICNSSLPTGRPNMFTLLL